jgi:hypothetical protein
VTTSALVGALTPVAECFEVLGVPYYVTGSLASSIHGIARASLDVDLVAALEPDHVEALVRCIGSAYYVPVDQVRAAVAHRRSFNLIHLATMFKIDVFVSRRRPFDDQAAGRARREPLDAGANARTVPVASPEDTILAKLAWFRQGGETSERQWWDVVGVLRVTRTADRAHLRTWANALGVADLLERALAEADARP